MHTLTSELLRRHPNLNGGHPLLVELLDFGAAVEPSSTTTDRPTRRAQQMRLLRQWERVEKAVAAFAAVGATDDDLMKHLPDGLWVIDGQWRSGGAAVNLRGHVADFLTQVSNEVGMRSPFLAPNGDGPLKAPEPLARQFQAIVTKSEPSHTMLDKFLRGSMKTAELLAQLLEHANDPEGGLGEQKTEALLQSAEDALLEQGFTR